MSYFPEDIPFMSKEELRENGIRIPKDATDTNVGTKLGTNLAEVGADCISRQAAIRWIKTECNPYGKPTLDYETSCRIMKHLDRMPPAQPEHKVRFADKDHVWIDGKQYISLPRFQEAVKEAQPKEGHWIEVAGELECSECHTVFTDLYPDYADSVACPHCGTKMKGADT